MSDEFHFPVIVVGAGGAGLCAALAARDLGADVLVLERDAVPMGSTAMSTGLIPAAGTPEQAEQGIDDSPERFASDVMAKTKGKADESIALKLGQESAETISWLRDKHNIPLSLIGGFLYPGHTAMRMYGDACLHVISSRVGRHGENNNAVLSGFAISTRGAP